MLSYYVASFGYDIIIFSAVCKIIIGGVQLRSFIGNFLKTHLYNVSEPILLSSTLIYCLMYKHAGFTCSALPSVLQCFIF